jgi:thiol:disulfide interchange protein
MKMSFTAKVRFTANADRPVTVNQAKSGATLTVTYQGCADAGFCYPPETKTVPLSEVPMPRRPLRRCQPLSIRKRNRSPRLNFPSPHCGHC